MDPSGHLPIYIRVLPHLPRQRAHAPYGRTPHFAPNRWYSLSGAKWGGAGGVRRGAAGALAQAALWAAGGQPQCFCRVVCAFWVAGIITNRLHAKNA